MESYVILLLVVLPAVIVSPVLFLIYLSRSVDGWRFRALIVSLLPNYATSWVVLRYVTIPLFPRVSVLSFDLPAFIAIGLGLILNGYPY